MIIIKKLDEVFKVWEDFSPYMHRPLITKRTFLKWAEELKFLSSFGSGKKDFYIFLEFLEEKELISPLKVVKRGTEFGEQMRSRRGVIYFGKPSEKKLDKIEKYYHPFQFIQLITFYNYLQTHSYENSEFYYFTRKKWIQKTSNDKKIEKKKIKRIEMEQYNWIKKRNKRMYKGFNVGIEMSEKYDTKTKKQMKRKNIKDMKDWNKKRKAYHPFSFNPHYWLNPDLLKVWIKIDSLIYLPDYIITPGLVHISHTERGVLGYDEIKRNKIFNEFKQWREEKIKKKEDFLKKKEIETLKKLHSTIYWHYFRHNSKLTSGIDNWRDLIDLLPDEKIGKITGFLNITLNLINILRFIARFTWYFFEFNLDPWPRNKKREKPYFCFSEDKEILDFRKSVISDFDLFISKPFILYVEGKTEETILNFYVKKKPWLQFKVKNIRGVDKNIYFLNLSKDIEEQVYFFFLDYENKDVYKRNKDNIKADGDFFFPDFITENFKPLEILSAFKEWTNDYNIRISSTLEEQIKNMLENVKQQSNNLILQTIKTNNPKGYEEILIDILMNNYQSKLLMRYSFLRKHLRSTSVDKGKLKKRFKKTFTKNQIIKIVENSLKDENREEFSFEEKLKPYYSKINNYKLRNHKIQYDLEI